MGRTKGNLYLLVTSRVAGQPRARGDADGRRHDPQRVLLRRVRRHPAVPDQGAGRRQQAARPPARPVRAGPPGDDGAGPIGVAVAVVRGRELYVATVGPAEAYLIRQARLSTLPDPNRDRGLPGRGARARGLARRALGRRLAVPRLGQRRRPRSGRTPSRTRWSRSTRSRRSSTSTRGSSPPTARAATAPFAFEASEVGATHKARTLVPVRPGRAARRARPTSSPIPLADSVTAGAAAIGAGATRARERRRQRLPAGRLADPGPPAAPQARHRARSPPTSSRMETQRRAAVAAARLRRRRRAPSCSASTPSAGQRTPTDAIKSLNGRPERLRGRQGGPRQRERPRGRPHRRRSRAARSSCSTAAYAASWTRPRTPATRSSQIAPLRATALDGLDRLYGVVPVTSTHRVHLPGRQARPARRASSAGPTARPTCSTPPTRPSGASTSPRRRPSRGREVRPEGVRHARSPTRSSSRPAAPTSWSWTRKNTLWRWRPVGNSKGKGTLVQDQGQGLGLVGRRHQGHRRPSSPTSTPRSTSSTSSTRPSRTSWSFARRATGRATRSSRPRRLPTDRPVDGITDLLHRRRHLRRRERRRSRRVIPAAGWKRRSRPRTRSSARRPTTRCSRRPTCADGDPSKRIGPLYAFDATNHRIVAFNKSDGKYVGAVPARRRRPTSWSDLQGMAVLPAADAEAPATLWWISSTGLHSALLEAGRRGRPPRRRRPAREPTDGARQDAQAHEDARSRDAAGGRPPVIPLRDANPTRRTPVVTLALIAPVLRRRSPGSWWCWPRAATRRLGDFLIERRGRCRRDSSAAARTRATGCRCRSWTSSPACSCTPAGCTCSATCCTSGSSATTSRTGSGGPMFLVFYLVGGARRGRRPGRSSTRRRTSR